MKATGFCLFEYDENDETLITFIYPSVDNEMKGVIQETAHFMIKNSNTLTLFTYFKSKWLYFEGKRNENRSDPVRLYGICLLADELHPAMYSAFATILCQIMHDTKLPPKVLRAYLKTMTTGTLPYDGKEFDIEKFPEDCFGNVSFDVILDRAGQYIPYIWLALVTGRSVAIYSPDVTVLQSCTIPILALCRPGQRQLLPLVLESSEAQVNAATATNLAIWCSCDNAVLSGRFDLTVDLSTRTAKFSPSFQKEAARDRLLDALMNTVNEATANESNVAEDIKDFNEQILEQLVQVKAHFGDISAQSIQRVKLPSETKMVLTAMASSGIFQI